MTKAAVIDDEQTVCAVVVLHTGAEHRRLAHQVMQQALDQAGLPIERIRYVVATGYGRIAVPFADRQLTELACHARGVVHYFPKVRLAIDIGGQDAKGLKIRDGKLLDFVMSDKCAAGTGRFLEVMATTLGVSMDELGSLAHQSTHKVTISSVCTVFARQEVTARIAQGEPVADILAGVHAAIASRTARMVDRLGVEPDVVFTGGVAANTGVCQALRHCLGQPILVPENPLLSGALGAALLARELVAKAEAKGESPRKAERRWGAATFFNDGHSGD